MGEGEDCICGVRTQVRGKEGEGKREWREQVKVCEKQSFREEREREISFAMLLHDRARPYSKCHTQPMFRTRDSHLTTHTTACPVARLADGVGVWRDLTECEISVCESPADETSRIRDLSLHRLDRVHFTYLLDSTAVRITHARNCTVVLAPVTSSVFVDHCENCTFYVASHQVCSSGWFSGGDAQA
jgi:Tubulin binding cofactor C